MPTEQLCCKQCGSSRVRELGTDSYVCAHCGTQFRWFAPTHHDKAPVGPTSPARLSTEGIEVLFPASWLARPEKYTRAEWGSGGKGRTPGRLLPEPGMVYLVEFGGDGADDDLKSLAQWAKTGRLRGLQAIRLRGTGEITDAGLAHLALLPDLQELHLEYLQVKVEVGCARVGAMSSLRVLTLIGLHESEDEESEDETDDQSLDPLLHLRALTNLRFLYLDPGYLVFPGSAAARLQKALPRCRILRAKD